jgi:hypothetical protein
MRGRIALPKHFPHTGGQAVRNAKRTLFDFVPQSRDFWSPHVVASLFGRCHYIA